MCLTILWDWRFKGQQKSVHTVKIWKVLLQPITDASKEATLHLQSVLWNAGFLITVIGTPVEENHV